MAQVKRPGEYGGVIAQKAATVLQTLLSLHKYNTYDMIRNIKRLRQGEEQNMENNYRMTAITFQTGVCVCVCVRERDLAAVLR